MLSTVITFTRHRTPLLLYPLYRRENLTTTHLPEVYTAGNHTTKTAVKTLQKQRYLVTISLHGEIHSTLCLPLHCHLCSPAQTAAVIVTTPRRLHNSHSQKLTLRHLTETSPAGATAVITQQVKLTLFLYCVLYIPLACPSSPAGFAVWLSRVQLWPQ